MKIKRITFSYYVAVFCSIAFAFSVQATNDTITIYEDQIDTIAVLPILSPSSTSFTILSQPKYGKVAKSGDTSLVFEPDSNFYSDSIYYDANVLFVDSFALRFLGDADSTFIYIKDYEGVNDAPIANQDSFWMKQNTGSVGLTLLNNDKDLDRVGLELKVVSNPRHGNVSFSSAAVEYNNKYLFFDYDTSTVDFNLNLKLPYYDRNMAYMDTTVLNYTPAAGFWGLDTLTYTIREYVSDILDLVVPIADKRLCYAYANSTEFDTAVVIIYVEPLDYLPVAVADTVSLFENDSTIVFYPCDNDLDADTISSVPDVLFSIPYIVETAYKASLDLNFSDTLYFSHDIAYYDSVSQQIQLRKDSNLVVLLDDTIYYTAAPGFCGVDSILYCVAEMYDSSGLYPDYLRGDTSSLSMIYFVTKPTNDLVIARPDTLFANPYVFESYFGGNVQYSNVFNNDVDIDGVDTAYMTRMSELLLGEFDPVFRTYYTPSIHVLSDSSVTTPNSAMIGDVYGFNDSLYYKFLPPYSRELLVDSFSYYVYDGSTDSVEVWCYVSNIAVQANDTSLYVAEPFVEDEIGFGIQIPLTDLMLDSDNDWLTLVVENDSALTSPSMSPYANIKYVGDNNINYYFEVGFETRDSFQYIASDFLTTDTAFVYINNGACEATNDEFTVSLNPFSIANTLYGPYQEELDVLSNDFDPEGILSVLLDNDTLDTGLGLVILKDDNKNVFYQFDSLFFYQDSFQYITLDMPSDYAEDGLFTRDTAWVTITDEQMLLDNDNDGIVNTMENGIPGYQVGEELLDTDGDGFPNYIDDDADNDGFPDMNDCDGDGVANFFDSIGGCDDIDVPNFFTPNGDGKNDLFVIPELMFSSTKVLDSSIKIYNRAGVLIYENDNYGFDGIWWDGNMGDVKGLSIGSELPEGVYFYYLSYKEGAYSKNGFVHIKR